MSNKISIKSLLGLTQCLQFHNSMKLFLILILTISNSLWAQEKTGEPLTGYVLTHEHPTQGMAFGGNYSYSGDSSNVIDGIMENAPSACGGCKIGFPCSHGEVNGYLKELGLTIETADMGVHSAYDVPKQKSFSHIRYSTEWVKEAFSPTDEAFADSNMKIMVAYAVENETMCKLLHGANKDAEPSDPGFACTDGDSFNSLSRQIDSIKAWINRNSDFMTLALTGKHARKIIQSGKLAIVLGVEADYAFGSEKSKFDPVDRLNEYFDLGVRTFYLAHKINNRLAGADIHHDKNNSEGKAIRMNQAIAGCLYYDDFIDDFPLESSLANHSYCNNNCGDGAFLGPLLTDKCVFSQEEISSVNQISYLLQGAKDFNGFDIYPKPIYFEHPEDSGGSRMEGSVERNNLGLSYDGERVVREALKKGMMLEIGHVSSRAREQIQQLTEPLCDAPYPLNAFHNKALDIIDEEFYDKSEIDFTDDELLMIKESGGFFGLRMGPTSTTISGGDNNTIDGNCPGTSTESAKMLDHILNLGLDVGYSLDYATFTEGVKSRTSQADCVSPGIDYLHGFNQEEVDGLVHIGVMSQWHKELESVGMEASKIEQLRNGAEAFVSMWENSNDLSASCPQKNLPLKNFEFTPENDECQNNRDCPEGEYCKTGKGLLGSIFVRDAVKNTCQPIYGNSGGACDDGNQCDSENEFCLQDKTNEQQCWPKFERGNACPNDGDWCSSGICIGMICR